MGRQIIETSPNKYGIFSSITDDFIGWDATKEEVIEFYKEDAAERAERDILMVFEQLESGKKPYHQFTMNLEEALDTIKSQHGDELYNERKAQLEETE